MQAECRFYYFADMTKLIGCSARTLERLIRAGHVPSPIRMGGQRAWLKALVDDWFANGCPKSKSNLKLAKA